MNSLKGWPDLWGRLYSDERSNAMAAAWRDIKSRDLATSVRETIAAKVKFRPATLKGWSDERMIGFMVENAVRVMNPALWAFVFASHLRNNERLSFAQAIALFGAEGPDNPRSPSEPPSALGDVVDKLVEEFGERKIGLIVDYLLLVDEGWAFLNEVRQRLATHEGDPVSAPQGPVRIEDSLTEFTTVDQVVIDQVVSAAAAAEGSLSISKVEDLVETIVALNPKRVRSFFHLGFLDGLITERVLDFERDDLNDDRKDWYLCGVLFAFARKHQTKSIMDLLSGRTAEFQRAARSAGAGLSMARALLPILVESGCSSEAALLVKSQIAVGGTPVAKAALDQAVSFLRSRQIATAHSLLLPIYEKYTPEEQLDSDTSAHLQVAIGRRMGQCLQMQGDFEGAIRLFKKACEQAEGEDAVSLRVDLGLATSRVKHLFDLRIPTTPAARRDLVQSLRLGEGHFRYAIDLSTDGAPGAHFVVGLMEYTLWREAGASDKVRREKVVKHLNRAISAMRLSDASAAYERAGTLSRASLMLAIASLHGDTPAEAKAALSVWHAPPPPIDFPAEEVRLFLESAYLADEAIAAKLAERIYEDGTAGLKEAILGPIWLERSAALRDQLLIRASDEKISRAQRFGWWCQLIPALLRTQLVSTAESGLDTMDRLADSVELKSSFLSYLSTNTNYDPAWSDSDAAWTRLRLCRELDDTLRSANELKHLFFSIRDTRPDDAADLLVAAENWRLDGDFIATLRAALPKETLTVASESMLSRLASGEAVSILFVGGNETQERYDETVLKRLHEKYSGVSVQFRHTGWGSNWGQHIDKLIAEANGADVVVLMSMIRTMLGRKLRANLNKPWVACVARGEQGMRHSIEKAATLAVSLRVKAGRKAENLRA